jgi:hypothetical protein
MARKLVQFKPGASCSTHLFVAAGMWTVVGIMLMTRGIIWLNGVAQLWIVLPALAIGSLKSLYMLDRSATKSIKRIVESRDGKCIGGVYSVKTWMLVLLMMGAGFLLRNSSLPRELLGLFYVSIGWGLFLSSRIAWFTWHQHKKR